MAHSVLEEGKIKRKQDAMMRQHARREEEIMKRRNVVVADQNGMYARMRRHRYKHGTRTELCKGRGQNTFVPVFGLRKIRSYAPAHAAWRPRRSLGGTWSSCLRRFLELRKMLGI